MLFLFRVSLQDVQKMIDLQTVNDTATPRSSISFYEQYHSLKVVRLGATGTFIPKTVVGSQGVTNQGFHSEIVVRLFRSTNKHLPWMP